jgi:beta-lactamase class D/5S rRNA maturation endonuclease (ribonuclease M5)
MPKYLVIVESPEKSKKIGLYLGKDYKVLASVGHVIDLPAKGLNVNIKKDFTPTYDIMPGKEAVVQSIVSAAKEVDIVYLMSDPDREGEAIAFHLSKKLPAGKPFKRAKTNSITKQSVMDAIANATDIDYELVDSYETRRILDRIVGYKCSFITTSATGGKSAGRVQSAALRVLAEREKEIQSFKPEEYWDITCDLMTKDKEKIQGYFNDKRKVFLDKIISGVYTPGSIVKPFLALGALNEGIISPEKQILSTGSISIPNPYLKDQKTVFKDWKAHGWTDMREAIAVSSDVYFYTIGGGFGDQKGMGISNIEKYARMFGIDQKTGIDIPDEKGGNIPNPEWKLKNFKNDPWRIGDTYHTAIGQYGFQVTPLEMARATSALANYGTLVTPHFLLNDKSKEDIKSKIEIPQNYYKVIHEGMRMTVTEGTGAALNVPYVKIAAKTGTAQLGVLKNKVNSWVIGFFPYEKPKYAFVVLMEAGPSQGTTGAAFISRELFDWMNENTPEYFSTE